MSAPPTTASEPRRTSSERNRVFGVIPFLGHPVGHSLVLIVALFLAMAAGAVFLPLASGADEPGHYVHAAAVVRGQVAELKPLLPAAIDNLHRFAGCIAFNPDVTGACSLEVTVANPSAIVVSDTGAGLYNPVFYAWTGLGSLVDARESGLYFARILAAMVTASVFGWSASFLLRRSRTRWATLSLLVVASPMVVYLGAVLNPSAWEIVTAIGVVVAAWAILFGSPESNRRWSEAHSLLVAAGSLMIVSRGLSPVFFIALLTTVVVAAGWRRTIAALRIPMVWAALAPIILVGIASLVWVAVNGTYYVGVTKPSSFGQGVRSIPIFYDDAFGQIAMMYGNLGWLDVPPLDVLVIAWLGAVVCFVFVGFSAATSTARWAIALSAATAILLPGVVAGLQWSGSGWQGRYTMPLVVGLVVLAGLSADSLFAREHASSPSLGRSLERVGTVAAVTLFVVGCATMFGAAARRYMVGASGPILGPAVWEPPLPTALLACCVVAGLTVFVTVVALGPVRSLRDADAEYAVG